MSASSYILNSLKFNKQTDVNTNYSQNHICDCGEFTQKIMYDANSSSSVARCWFVMHYFAP